jgi:hypothetical protein
MPAVETKIPHRGVVKPDPRFGLLMIDEAIKRHWWSYRRHLVEAKKPGLDIEDRMWQSEHAFTERKMLKELCRIRHYCRPTWLMAVAR